MNRRLAILIALAVLPGLAPAQADTPPNQGVQASYVFDPVLDAFKVVVSWPSLVGYAYFVQCSEDLLTWTYLPAYLKPGTGDVLSLNSICTGSKLFYRLRRTPAPSGVDLDGLDFDGDGVSNKEELLNGTDPLKNTDSDSDGLPDDWERFYFQNIAADPAADGDGDGLRNSAEFAARTNPNNPDSDGDGISDGAEVANGTDPKVANPTFPHDFVVTRLSPDIRTFPPPTPADPCPPPIITRSVRLSWSAPAKPVEQFIIFRRISPLTTSGGKRDEGDGSWTRLATVIGSVTVYDDRVQLHGAAVNYRIYAKNSTQQSPASIERGFDLIRVGGIGDAWSGYIDDPLPEEPPLPEGSLTVGGVSDSWGERFWSNSCDPDPDYPSWHGWSLYAWEETESGVFLPFHGSSAEVIARTVRAWGMLNAQKLYLPSRPLRDVFYAGAKSADLPPIPSNPDGTRKLVIAVSPVPTPAPAAGMETIGAHEPNVAKLMIDVQPALPSGTMAITVPNGYKLFKANGTEVTDLTMSFANQGGEQLSPKITLFLKAYPGASAGDLVLSIPGVEERVALLPVEMMVDANRDGEMSFTEAATHDKDGTTAEKPYRFWLNNDHDEGHTVDGNDWEEDDTYAAADNADTIIQWRRDLEDFSRLWITFKGITEMVKQTDFKVRLEWKPNEGDTWTAADGNPGIRIFKAFEEQDGGRQYLEDENVAWQQLDGVQGAGNHNNFSQALGTNGGLVKGGLAGQSTVDLPATFLSDLSDSNPYKHLLFEGFSAGKGRLILTLYKGTQKIGEYPPVYLELLDIRDMYERYTVGDDNGGASQATAALQTYNQASGYTRAGHSRPFAYADNDPEEKKYILYVHGWNMTPGEKDHFSATAYKRLFWQGYKGRFGIYEWPTTYGFGEAYGFTDSNPVSNLIASGIDASGDQTNYDRGEWSAWRSAPMLRALLTQLNQKYSGQVNVIAHSMGNVVTGEALRLQTQNGGGQLVKTYVASQAALPVHCYDATIGDNLIANRTVLGIHFGGNSTGLDTPNIYKNWLSSNAGAVGKRVKFFNVNDYALWEDVWQLNQWFKPDNRDLPSQPWWYHFTGNKTITPPEDKFTKSNGPAILGGETFALHLGSAANVENRYEIMSFAAESYSKALGGMSGPTAFNAAVDLHSLWPPDSSGAQRPYSAHKWHSAQFRGTNMQQKNYWKKLVGPDAFDVVPQP